jgi:RNA polymerase sigma factor (sigma-70 family)
MAIQHPTALLRADQDAELRYELARQRLAVALAERIAELDLAQPDSGRARYLAERRKAVIDEGFRFVGPLSRYIRAELARWSDDLSEESDVAPTDDIIAATYLAALDEAETAPPVRAFYTWLRRIARREIRALVVNESERRRRERSLETPIASVGREWPDRAIRLLDVLADPIQPLPEQIIVDEEQQAVLNVALARLPERWREVFLLRVVDGWSEEEVAAAEGLDAWDVRLIVNGCRTFVREWLEYDATLQPA